MTKILLLLIASGVLAIAQINPTPLTGTWKVNEFRTSGPNGKITAISEPGFYLFTGDRFSVLTSTSGEPRPNLSRPADDGKTTVAQVLAAWGPFNGWGGRYMISGDTVAMQALVSMRPRVMGGQETLVSSFRIEGNQLTLTTVRDANGPIANPSTTILTRVEPGQFKQTVLTGSWQVTEFRPFGASAVTSPQPGFYTFTGDHFSVLRVTSDRPRPDLPNRPADDGKTSVPQLLAAWQPFTAWGGTYTISDDTVAMTALVAKGALTMNRQETMVYTFRLDGKKLILTQLRDVNGPITKPYTLVFTRVE